MFFVCSVWLFSWKFNILKGGGVILHFGKENSLQFTQRNKLCKTFLSHMKHEVLRAVKITVVMFGKSKLCDLVDG